MPHSPEHPPADPPTSRPSSAFTPPPGLTEKAALHRLAQYGKNQLVVKKQTAAWRKLLANFKNPLVLILLIAAVLSGLLGEVKSGVLILAIIVFSTLLNFYQEQKSSRAAEKLQEKLSLTTAVIRGGEQKEINVMLVVPGDVVFLSAGDIVPADGTILFSEDLFVNESALTGESFPVEKISASTQPNSKLAEALAGTNVVSGSGYITITKTGPATEFGKIAAASVAPSVPDAFEKGVNSFGYLIVKLSVFIVLAVFLINTFKPLLLHGPFTRETFIQSLLFALAIAVGLTPELLPMIMSINMAKGSLRMAKKGVIVKRLNAIPDFGSIDILCTDKTGTLTEGKIALVKYLDVSGEQSDEVLRYAYLNSFFQTGLKNPLDNAILDFKHLSSAGYRKIDEIPYDFQRKRLSVVTGKDHRFELIAKGQPEEILKICTRFQVDGATHPVNSKFLHSFNAVYNNLSKEGFKTLAICVKEVDSKQRAYAASEERGMTMLGLVGFFDPPKASAAKTLAELAARQVEVKIITGDNEIVTQKICAELNLAVKGVLTGDQIEGYTDAALAVHAPAATIFARCNPEQKKRIITALRAHGHVVGYLGDGINDAPSLQAADIGISVSNAVDVAKETADIILSNKSLHELTQGILEGRRTFGNTMKYLMMGMSSNFGNMFSLIAAAIYLPFLPILPYQVLLNNSLYDLSQTTIPSDNVDSEYLARPKQWNVALMKKFMITFGLLSSVFDVLTFYFLFHYFHLPPASFQTGWFVESLATQTLVIYIIRTRKFFLRSRPSGYLVFTTLVIAVVGFILPFTALGRYFSFVPLPTVVLITIGGLVVSYLFIVEIAKHLFYRFVPEN